LHSHYSVFLTLLLLVLLAQSLDGSLNKGVLVVVPCLEPRDDRGVPSDDNEQVSMRVIIVAEIIFAKFDVALAIDGIAEKDSSPSLGCERHEVLY
jgi:hypothetical protein